MSRWVIQITVLTRSPDGRRDTSSIVSNISFWACASSADVYMGHTRSGTKFSKIGVGVGVKKKKKEAGCGVMVAVPAGVGEE